METKAKIVVMSHLSDMQEMQDRGSKDDVDRLNFVKYIIIKTGGDLNTWIDPDQMYEDFLNSK